MINPINILPPSSKSTTLQSPHTITPTSNLISDVDLCTRHIHEDVSILAGSLGISSANLEVIEQDYREAETQAYCVLKNGKTLSQAMTSFNIFMIYCMF